MKIIAVDTNFLTSDDNTSDKALQPIIYLKPDSSLLKDGKPFFIPDFSGEITAEPELVIRINRLGKNIAEKFAHRYYEEVTIGLNITAEDIFRELKKKSLPWELAKSFDGSSIIGNFINKNSIFTEKDISFKIEINNKTLCERKANEMTFSIDKIISFVSNYFTLKIGDIIFTGAKNSRTELSKEDNVIGYINDKMLLNINIK